MKNKKEKCNHEWRLIDSGWDIVKDGTSTGPVETVSWYEFYCIKCTKILKK